ncbi:hypothetical protein BSNT_09802 [Bacillus subtilis subsp. natto BEST195]|nr:hypothetical protein BSNT_09802 [Bacillus subtilis subsp. natto BEST195]
MIGQALLPFIKKKKGKLLLKRRVAVLRVPF